MRSGILGPWSIIRNEYYILVCVTVSGEEAMANINLRPLSRARVYEFFDMGILLCCIQGS